MILNNITSIHFFSCFAPRLKISLQFFFTVVITNWFLKRQCIFPFYIDITDITPSPRGQYIMGSNLGLVKPKTLKLVFVASLLSTQHLGKRTDCLAWNQDNVSV